MLGLQPWWPRRLRTWPAWSIFRGRHVGQLGDNREFYCLWAPTEAHCSRAPAPSPPPGDGPVLQHLNFPELAAPSFPELAPPQAEARCRALRESAGAGGFALRAHVLG